jgi:glucose-1-phosphate cytidylyltransferase
MTTVHPPSRFGCVETGPDDQVRRFSEKGKIASWVNAGFFVFGPEIFRYLTGDACALGRRPLERLAEEGELMAFHHRGFFFAMDTPRDHQQLSKMYHAGHTPWMVWEIHPCTDPTAFAGSLQPEPTRAARLAAMSVPPAEV